MPPNTDNKGGGIAQIALTVLAVVAAFLVLRFVVGVAMAIMKWIIIAAGVLFVAWLFMRDSGGGKRSS
ncbi:MAG: hypothetical protein KC635_09600 [Myxococcales bacterium]|nr:hypothetical protein [Myxococcales bacterium]MCB9732297.1 hypothetical protein [Deltaproteobacteria bacterium]